MAVQRGITHNLTDGIAETVAYQAVCVTFVVHMKHPGTVFIRLHRTYRLKTSEATQANTCAASDGCQD